MGFARLRSHELVAPPLMVVEASSVLHEMAWRKDVGALHAEAMLERLLEAPIETRSPPGLSRDAWRVIRRTLRRTGPDARLPPDQPRRAPATTSRQTRHRDPTPRTLSSAWRWALVDTTQTPRYL